MTAPAPDVILVDDDPLMVELLDRFLTRAGWRVRAFMHALDALESALADPPVLVLTDWAMPVLDGVGLARALRERLGSHAPKLVLITAAHQVAGEESLAFDLVVGKPFRGFELVEQLRALVEDGDSSHTRLVRPAADEGSDGERQSGT